MLPGSVLVGEAGRVPGAVAAYLGRAVSAHGGDAVVWTEYQPRALTRLVSPYYLVVGARSQADALVGDARDSQAA